MRLDQILVLDLVNDLYLKDYTCAINPLSHFSQTLTSVVDALLKLALDYCTGICLSLIHVTILIQYSHHWLLSLKQGYGKYWSGVGAGSTLKHLYKHISLAACKTHTIVSDYYSECSILLS